MLLPFYDAVRMMLYYEDVSFLLHPVYAWYVMIEIVFQYSMKVIGIKKANHKYG